MSKKKKKKKKKKNLINNIIPKMKKLHFININI